MKRVLVAGLLLAASQTQAADYRWLNGWDRNSPQVPLLVEPYLKAVEAATQGRVKFTVSGPETVPAFEQLQPVAAGAFHFLFTHGVYHFGTTPLLAVMDTLGGTPEQRASSGVFEKVDQMYQRNGLKVVHVPFGPDGGYQLVLRAPLGPNGDLQGKKIRGNPSYASVIRLLGASVVTMPISEIYTAMDKGVVDGFAFPTYGVMDNRFHEVSKVLLRPAFGFGTLPIIANLATWNKIEARDQKIMIDEAKKISQQWYDMQKGLVANEERELLAKGMTIGKMSPQLSAKLPSAFADGNWEVAAQKHKKDVEELRAFVKSKGLN